MPDVIQSVNELIKQSALTGKSLKGLLRQIVSDNWPDLPKWTTLKAPVIEEVQKASVGGGVVLTYKEDGVRKVVVAEAGSHYEPKSGFMIPGGFLNLSRTRGSSFVAASFAPEDPRVGAAREVEEELKNADGSPVLKVDPARFKLMDAKTLFFEKSGETQVVMGMMLELTPEEIALVKAHTAKLATDADYKAAVMEATVNEASGKPEVGNVAILNLEDVAQGKHGLLHPDQLSLFNAVNDHFKSSAIVTASERVGPTRAYKEKVKTLDELKELVKQWRTEEGASIGVTSGVFDILHPGHTAFLEDCKHHCNHLIVIIASDRTVKTQKGDEKPYINELKRAQTMAAITSADAVIVSDEPYHETILTALKPDMMFKGDDYKDKTIIGADLVGKVVLIPCAEKEFFSSSAFATKIQNARQFPIQGAGPAT